MAELLMSYCYTWGARVGVGGGGEKSTGVGGGGGGLRWWGV